LKVTDTDISTDRALSQIAEELDSSLDEPEVVDVEDIRMEIISEKPPDKVTPEEV